MGSDATITVSRPSSRITGSRVGRTTRWTMMTTRQRSGVTPSGPRAGSLRRVRGSRRCSVHPEIIEWVNEARRLARPGARVVEVGSGDMNGTVRQLFPASDYVGVDLRIGAGMEILGDARALPLQSDSCDLVLCLSVLEHVRCWRRIVLEIGRVLRLKGVAIITAAATGYP